MFFAIWNIAFPIQSFGNFEKLYEKVAQCIMTLEQYCVYVLNSNCNETKVNIRRLRLATQESVKVFDVTPKLCYKIILGEILNDLFLKVLCRDFLYLKKNLIFLGQHISRMKYSMVKDTITILSVVVRMV